ncbi:hypothetical protein TL16_g09752 [Triparma laevis f. inornata]|uniref:Tyrosine-protein kinase ephrin type A/B receptor-like domain-containing protein n=1 Tax=Triparma laevis f. inornata TaxID=1714386 RepID=A0A9W7BBU8_9STRA|nr:hypothetical protein TL16_g09752 [Triparma laevis f. inornata]
MSEGWNAPSCYDSFDSSTDSSPSSGASTIECPGRLGFFDPSTDIEIDMKTLDGDVQTPILRAPYNSGDASEKTFKIFDNICLSGCSCFVAKVHDGSGYVGNLDGGALVDGFPTYPVRQDIVDIGGDDGGDDDTVVVVNQKLFIIKNVDDETLASHTSYSDIPRRYTLKEEFCITETCNPCNAGEYLHPSNLVCTPCPAGRYNDDISKLSECTKCPRGTYNENTGGSSISDCSTCGAGKASTIEEATSELDCNDCTDGTEPSETHSDCVLFLSVSTHVVFTEYVDVNGANHATTPAGSVITFADGVYIGDRVTTATDETNAWFATVRGLDGERNAILDGDNDGNGHIMVIGPVTVDRTFTLLYLHFKNTLGGSAGGLYIKGGCQGASEDCPIARVDIVECSFTENTVYGGDASYGAAITIQNTNIEDLDLLTLRGVYFAKNNKFGFEGADVYVKQASVTVSGNCDVGEASVVTGDLSVYAKSGITDNSYAYGDLYSQGPCTSCDPGFYNDELNSLSCTACPAGKWISGYGNTDCQGCPVGRFNEDTGASDLAQCEECEGGKYSNAVNATTSFICQSCEAGKFIMETGSYKCDDCDRGKYSSMNSFECFECAPGRYMNSTGQESCHECMIGSYAVDYGAFICSTCSPGTYSETMGTVFCIECAAGKYGTDGMSCSDCDTGKIALEGSANCTSCEEGERAASTACIACEAGKYAGLGWEACMVCAEGSVSRSRESLCTQCMPGTYAAISACVECSAGKRSPEGVVECQECPAGRYSYERSGSCFECPIGTFAMGTTNTQCTDCALVTAGSSTVAVASDSDSKCVCGSGTYNKLSDGECTDVFTLTTEKRPPVSNSSGMTTKTLELMAGYWRVSINSTEVQKCDLDGVCLGGLTDPGGDDTVTCSEGHRGPFCSVCQNNFAMSGGVCVKCEGSATNTVVMGVLVILGGIAGLLFVSHKLHKLAHEEGGFDIDKQQELVKEAEKKLLLMKNKLMKLRVKAKIVLSYLQIATGLAFNFDLKFPVNYTALMNRLAFINLDFGGYMPFGCMVEFSYLTQLYSSTIFSLAVIGLLFGGSVVAARRSAVATGNLRGQAYVLPEVEVESQIAAAKTETKGSGKTDWSSLLFNNLLLFTFLILPSISTKIIHTFACSTLHDDDGEVNVGEDGLPINPNEGHFLKADYSVRCNSSERELAFIWALVMCFVFPLGIPVWYFFLLRGQRHLLDPGQDALLNSMNVKIPHRIEGLEKSMAFEYIWPERDEEAEKEVGGGAVLFKALGEDILKGAVLEKGGIVVCLDEEEAMLCSLWRRRELEKTHPKLARLKFLYDSYECKCWWFEVFETWRKLMLTSGLIFFSAGSASQIVVSIMICLLSMRVYSGVGPFINENDDKLAETAQWQLFFTLFGALMLRVDVTAEYGDDKDAFGDVLVAVQFVIPILIIYQLVLKKGKKGGEDEEGEGEENQLTAFFEK